MKFLNEIDGASKVIQDANNRFVTDSEKSTWNGKQNAITGGASTITSSNLTTNRALVSDSSGKVAVSAVTSTELGYISGVTSSIQTQLNGKASTSHSHTISDVSGLQTALDGKSASTHNHTLDGLSNTTITSNTNGEILRWNGSAWVNNTLAEAGIAPVSHTHTRSQITDLGTIASINTNASTSNYLRGDGTWVTPPNTTYSNVTTTTSGLMSNTDKIKLDGIATGANNYTHPATHPASIIAQDVNNRFVTDSEKSIWNNSVSYNDVIMNTNPFGGKKLYINSINNALFSAHKRWNVEAKIYNSDDSISSTVAPDALFNGDYEGGISIPAGKYLKVQIDFNGYFPNYPYGDVYLSHYHTSYSGSAKLRVYCNFEPHGIGWHESSFTDFLRSGTSGLITVARQSKFNISLMEIIVYARSDMNASITDIDFRLDRPSTTEMPIFDKFRQNKMYYNIDMNTNKILNSSEPTANSDLTTKYYVDNALSGKQNSLGSGTTSQYLRGDGAWVTPPNTTYSVATTSANGLMSSTDKTKLDGVATSANNYTHPATHPPSIIVQDASNRFVTDAEKSSWNAKSDIALGTVQPTVGWWYEVIG